MGRPIDDRGSAPPPLTTMPMERPVPIKAGPNFVSKTINSLFDVKRSDATVTIDGTVVANKAQSADALAMLGIDTAAIDDGWAQFVVENSSRPDIFYDGRWEQDHQDGMGWRVDITIDGGPSLEVRDLAYADVRAGTRKVTYRCLRWSPSGAHLRGEPATSEVVTRQETLEDQAGAVGAWWSGVTDDQISATEKASAALHAARRQIEEAWKEIGIAYRVAQRAWEGPRAEAAKFKFAMESEQVTVINNVTWSWERYVHDLVTEQREAKKEDERLVNEIRDEGFAIAIGTVLTRGASNTLVAGVAVARRSAWVLAKLKSFSRRMDTLRRSRVGRFWATHATAAEAAKQFANKALLDGVRDFAGHAALDPGKTLDEWWKSFVLLASRGAAPAQPVRRRPRRSPGSMGSNSAPSGAAARTASSAEARRLSARGRSPTTCLPVVSSQPRSKGQRRSWRRISPGSWHGTAGWTKRPRSGRSNPSSRGSPPPRRPPSPDRSIALATPRNCPRSPGAPMASCPHGGSGDAHR